MAEFTPQSSTSSGSGAAPQNSIVFLQNSPVSVKLKETNYLIWRQQVLATIRGYGLEGFLTGTMEKPQEWISEKGATQRTPNPDYINWERQDQLLAAWLQSSLSEGIMVLVVGLSSTSDIWRALETNFSSQSKAKLMQYKLQLQTLKKDNLSMSEYLTKIKTCCDLLGSAGYKVSADDQILHVLAGLGSEYDPVMVSITSRIEPWSILDVQSLLLSFESRLESSKSTPLNSDGSQPSAHYANHNNTQRGGHFGFQHTRGRGFQASNRGGRGGSNRGVFNGGRGRGRSPGNKPVCQVCFIPGHTADRCWHRFDQTFVAKQQQQQNQQSPGHYKPSSNMVQVPSSQASTNAFNYAYSDYNSDHTWYPDSGATNHVSNDLSNLNLASEYQGSNRLQMGNGFGVDIAHIGTTSLISPSHPRPFILHNLLHVPKITKNLLSVSQFARDNRVFFEFHPEFCFVKDQVTKEILLKGILKRGLYQFILHKSFPASSNIISSQPQPSSPPVVSSAVLSSPAAYSVSLVPAACSVSLDSLSIDVWHKRLGHCNFDILQRALSSCNIKFNKKIFCCFVSTLFFC